MALRSPIVSVLGHVDHGKSSVLDAIRGTNIIATEAGAITQAIGASIIPLDVIKKKCGSMLKNMNFTIPGLLFIDTPGHAAFTNLRKRGGSLADIAIVVIDISEGFKPQTTEAIEILKNYKTPFIIVANKMDMIPGYYKKSDVILEDVAMQTPEWISVFDTKIYELVGAMHENFRMESERFDRVESFTKQVAIVPAIASSNHGISELLMVLTGMAQKFLEENLNLNTGGLGKGTVLEVKETTGFGTTIDVILYDGSIKINDVIVVGGVKEPLVTKIRAMLEPNPLQEMRDKKSKYIHVKEATAATGIRIAAPDLEKAMAGMPVRVATDVEAAKKEVQAEVEGVLIKTDSKGIIIKADTIGSLEALGVLLREKGIFIRSARVGNISKKDIADAESNFESDPATSVILGFNVEGESSTEKVKVITGNIIYSLADQYEEWQDELKKKQQKEKLKNLMKPCKIQIVANCIFRQSNPCVAGIEVLGGTLQTGTPLMKKEGKQITIAKSIQKSNETLSEVKFGEQAAVSLPDVMAGRQLNEKDVLYSAIPEAEFRKIKSLAKLLSPDEKEVLKEIAEVMRKDRPLWGV